MEIFNELYDMDHAIESNMESLYNFRYYRYCNRIGAKEEYAATDLFSPNLQQVRNLADETYSHKFIAHLPQNQLVRLLADKLENNGMNVINYGHELIRANNRGNKIELEFFKFNEKQNYNDCFDFVIACDGFHSRLRSIAEINLSSTKHKMCFLNVHFISKELAQSLLKRKRNGMLHFVYNSKVM